MNIRKGSAKQHSPSSLSTWFTPHTSVPHTQDHAHLRKPWLQTATWYYIAHCKEHIFHLSNDVKISTILAVHNNGITFFLSIAFPFGKSYFFAIPNEF